MKKSPKVTSTKNKPTKKLTTKKVKLPSKVESTKKEKLSKSRAVAVAKPKAKTSKVVTKKVTRDKVPAKKSTAKKVSTKKTMIKAEAINAAILLAGGSGSRMRGTVKDKVLEPLLGLPIILHSFKAFLESGQIGEVIFVCRDELQKKSIRAELKKHFPNVAKRFSIKFANGGAERQDSVYNGLAEVSDKSALAFIHDGARPLVGAENIVLLAAAAMRDGASVLAAKVADTIKRAPANGSIENIKLEDLDRSRLWAMETPQVFKASEIIAAYKFVRKNKMKITDDVAAFAALGLKISIVENINPNPKITLPQDIARVEFLKMRKA